jgi:hypothetical protein
MERHLCADGVVIPPEIRTSFRQLVYERLCVHINQLFDIDIAYCVMLRSSSSSSSSSSKN